MSAIKDYLLDQSETLVLPLDHHCYLGAWLANHERNRFGQPHEIAKIQKNHKQVHELADILLAARAQGKNAEKSGRVAELIECHNAFLNQLKLLLLVNK
jgi:hypothetical protein